jgi:dinuclear metal center YbgI/SA1388 family protein
MPTRNTTTRRRATRPGATIADLSAAMEAIAPRRLAQDWDNVGLLAGDPAARCTRALLCIDMTPAVLDEARRLTCEAVVAYHPPLFRPVASLRADADGTEALVFHAIASGIAIHSPHTALDAADGGTNDVLAALCGLRDTEPFTFVDAAPPGCKIVTFVPPANLDAVTDAMFAAGAGRIGAYEKCSYRLAGRGTFFGTDETNPAVGQKGRLETVDEIRVEMVAPTPRLPEIVAAMTAAHPYETPAYDVYPLAPLQTRGIGRVGNLPAKTTLATLARSLKAKTKSRVVQIVGEPKQRIRRAAVCAGAAGRLPLEHPRSADADVIVTGEIHHHDALACRRLGKGAIALGHAESERPVLPVLAKRLRAALPALDVRISKHDTGPFTAL